MLSNQFMTLLYTINKLFCIKIGVKYKYATIQTYFKRKLQHVAKIVVSKNIF